MNLSNCIFLYLNLLYVLSLFSVRFHTFNQPVKDRHAPLCSGVSSKVLGGGLIKCQDLEVDVGYLIPTHVGPIEILLLVAKLYNFCIFVQTKTHVASTLSFWVLQKPIEHSVLWRHVGNYSTAPSVLLKVIGSRCLSRAHLLKYISHTSILGLE